MTKFVSYYTHQQVDLVESWWCGNDSGFHKWILLLWDHCDHAKLLAADHAGRKFDKLLSEFRLFKSAWWRKSAVTFSIRKQNPALWSTSLVLRTLSLKSSVESITPGVTIQVEKAIISTYISRICILHVWFQTFFVSNDSHPCNKSLSLLFTFIMPPPKFICRVWLYLIVFFLIMPNVISKCTKSPLFKRCKCWQLCSCF